MIQVADNRTSIHPILESIVNGQYDQAKELIAKGCKTKPEMMAQRLGRVILAIHDEDIADNFGLTSDHAAMLINQFNKHYKEG